jgi:hypothetical protein
MECLILNADFGHRDAEPWASHTAVSERSHHGGPPTRSKQHSTGIRWAQMRR